MCNASGATRLLVYAVAAAAWIQSPDSGSQSYPSKPVRYVIPFAAGTGNDIVGRLIADGLTRSWGQQVIVDNRVGASGTIGAAFVAKSPPDGSRCFIATSPRMRSLFP